LRARGRRLVLVARRADRLAALARELGGAEVLPLPLDLTEPDAGARLQEELDRKGIFVDLLVNNAGVGHTGRFLSEPPDRVAAMIDLNVRAVVDLTRRLVPAMVARKTGAVVNVVSTSAFQPVPYLAVYAASKAFALSFTEALADELRGTGVRVQALCPGLTESEFHRTAGTDKVLFTRTAMMTAPAVVERSLRALDRGTLRVVPGWQNRVMASVQAFVPRSLVRTVAGRLFRPRPGSA
jgi:short-subunit dehydrogenase